MPGVGWSVGGAMLASLLVAGPAAAQAPAPPDRQAQQPTGGPARGRAPAAARAAAPARAARASASPAPARGAAAASRSAPARGPAMAEPGWPGFADGGARIAVHGFVSQGALLSTGNDYLAHSKRGSVEFFEAAVNRVDRGGRPPAGRGCSSSRATWDPSATTAPTSTGPTSTTAGASGSGSGPGGSSSPSASTTSSPTSTRPACPSCSPRACTPPATATSCWPRPASRCTGARRAGGLGGLDYQLAFGTIFVDVAGNPAVSELRHPRPGRRPAVLAHARARSAPGRQRRAHGHRARRPLDPDGGGLRMPAWPLPGTTAGSRSVPRPQLVGVARVREPRLAGGRRVRRLVLRRRQLTPPCPTRPPSPRSRSASTAWSATG